MRPIGSLIPGAALTALLAPVTMAQPDDEATAARPPDAPSTVVIGSDSATTEQPADAPDESASTTAGDHPGSVTSGASVDGSAIAPENRRVFGAPTVETRTILSDWFGAGADLRALGISTTLNLWLTAQGNVSGGERRTQALTGLYYFTNGIDFEKLIGLKGTSALVRLEGGWDAGLNPDIGALMNVNGLAVGDNPVGITRLWLQQDVLDDRVRVRVGKFDFSSEGFDFHDVTVAFDAIPYANAPQTQFLNAGLTNNPTIPFPDVGFGIMGLVEPIDRWYVAAAAFNVNSELFSLDVGEAFGGDRAWMTIVETGCAVSLGPTKLPGFAYAGWWYSQYESIDPGQGVYLGVSQQLYREPDGGGQGLGLFARYGFASAAPSGIDHSWSAGVQYAGLIPGRDDDVTGLGWVQAYTDGERFTAPFEGALELYYRARITPWLHLSPSIEWIVNPGSQDAPDSVILGLRGQFTF